MAAYAQQTVKLLQKELESRKLSTNGIKKDLIARLEANDAEKLQKTLVHEQDEKKEEEPIEAPKNVQDPSEEQVETNASSTTQVQTSQRGEKPAVTPKDHTPIDEISPAVEMVAASESEPEQKTKTFTPEEAKTKALEHLQVKLRRAQKFADDQSTIDSLQRQIARIQKFGLDQTTQLALELGLGKGPQNTIARRGNKKSQRKSPKNKR
ncbi:LAME_0F13828g1_1 [Lachancea meyersii CBS 8951]|uniref:LAME_0F13828g1_1 n=1 Tax=Lachancea meyersii CBS 8951 TaxID=1266667 RepID=A0A1G4JXT7_9SACH|nr:LAME_0F13828g1_1 [Lachancea meyersii CBS 8951]